MWDLNVGRAGGEAARSGRGGKDAMWGGIARGKGSRFAGVDRNRLANYLFILKSDSGG